MNRTACLAAILLVACSSGGGYVPPPGGGDMAMKVGGPDAGACGNVGEPCCANQSCSNGASCTNNVCVSPTCGKIGQTCCNGTTCTDANSVCTNGSCVMQQANCGHLGQTCCNGTTCTDANTVCTNGICAPQAACGTLGNPCCNGTTCNDGSVCKAGVCSNPGLMQAVGHTCQVATDCSGPNAQCYKTIPTYNWTAAGGYCSNSNCVTDNNCGTGGFCDTQAHECFQLCSGAGSCNANNPNNRCFNFDGVHSACLPLSASQCNPMLNGTCNNTNACETVGDDPDVGLCMTTCTLPNNCANGKNCVFFNERYDLNGNATPDVFAGTVCFTAGATQPGQACTHIDDCTLGYECDIFGTKVCKLLCKNGTTICPNGGLCKDTFKQTSFLNGSTGLCLP